MKDIPKDKLPLMAWRCSRPEFLRGLEQFLKNKHNPSNNFHNPFIFIVARKPRRIVAKLIHPDSSFQPFHNYNDPITKTQHLMLSRIPKRRKKEEFCMAMAPCKDGHIIGMQNYNIACELQIKGN
ncbi:hypothetical protein Peur_007586 [Populus x canadensis]